jgi:hypothetical protein
MRYLLIFTMLLMTPVLSFCQEMNNSDNWLKQLENPNRKSDRLKRENSTEKYRIYDFSPFLKPESEFLGFIGSDYRRIMIKFISVRRDVNPEIYQINGSSLVNNNKCDFTGQITVRQIREFETLHFGVDEKYRDSGIKAQGVLIGDYSLKENKNQAHSGEFSGIMTLWWYIDKDGKLRYDDINSYSDSYRNNQYIGVWKNFTDNEEKTCNWGEYRIPFSGDLDIGAGEFSPNKKYYDKGWKQ